MRVPFLVVAAVLAAAVPLGAQQGQGHLTSLHRAAWFAPAVADATCHFHLYPDGGLMDCTAAGPEALAPLRTELALTATRWTAGDFGGRTHRPGHGRTPTGADELLRLRDEIAYRYEPTGAGGHVDIRTASPEALVAVHAFLVFHIIDGDTGDSREVTSR